MMNNDRKEVKTRYLVSSEREIPILSKEFPLVIEPNTDNSLEFICEYLSANSNFILDNIREHGAILLRGFALKEACDFEKVMLSIKGLSGISHLFLDKANRKAVEGTQYVFPTNNIVRTGGTTNLSAFHSENYYTPEIPQFISFFCKSPAVYGGETGIVDMEKVFLLMNDGLKDKITNKLFFVKKWPITEVCKKYNLDRAALEEVCANYGLLIEGDYIFLNKPCAFVNPNTQVMSFVAACSREIQGLNEFILEIFKESYRSYKWFKHKLLWRLPNFHKKYHLAVIIKNFIRYPKRFKPIFKDKLFVYI